MFRRIELIDEMDADGYRKFIEAMRQSLGDPEYNLEKEHHRFLKSGLTGFGNPVVWEAWAQDH